MIRSSSFSRLVVEFSRRLPLVLMGIISAFRSECCCPLLSHALLTICIAVSDLGPKDRMFVAVYTFAISYVVSELVLRNDVASPRALQRDAEFSALNQSLLDEPAQIITAAGLQLPASAVAAAAAAAAPLARQ
jgi:hypothetical protein